MMLAHNLATTRETNAMIIRAILLLFVSTFAYASDTARINGKIVTTGMGVTEVVGKVGRPGSRTQIENKFGASIGERWEYMSGTKMIVLTVQGGRVVRIDE